MPHRKSFWIAGLAALAWITGALPANAQASWIGTWETSPAGLPTVTTIGGTAIPSSKTVKVTVRYRLRIAQGGSQLRLRFSNEYGDTSLVLHAVSVGVAEEGLNAVSHSLKRVAFGGRSGITVPPGAPALRDPVHMRVKALGDLVVSAYAPDGI